ncbi:MAG TPA: T9SS type A sorting domain-containing protein, partial [Chitinophagales bacterium]|nr:T9SS type A sorting domain-containing protein [Chitinophagales bacterium]
NAVLKIYPNPVSGLLLLCVSQELMQSPSVAAVTDITGRIVLTQPLWQPAETINTNSLAKGIYLLTVSQSGNIRACARFVKQ